MLAITDQLIHSLSDACYNQWSAEPDPLGETCNIFEKAVTILLRCSISRVASSSNTSIVWMYSNDEASAGIDGQILMENVALDRPGSDILLASLTLPRSINGEIKLATGYYWCMITNAATGLYQNPSRVVRITETCYSNACDPTEIRVPQRVFNNCANGDFRENLTIVDLLDKSGCMPGEEQMVLYIVLCSILPPALPPRTHR